MQLSYVQISIINLECIIKLKFYYKCLPKTANIYVFFINVYNIICVYVCVCLNIIVINKHICQTTANLSFKSIIIVLTTTFPRRCFLRHDILFLANALLFVSKLNSPIVGYVFREDWKEITLLAMTGVIKITITTGI